MQTLILLIFFHLLVSTTLFVSVIGRAKREDWTYQISKPRVFLTCFLWPKWIFKK